MVDRRPGFFRKHLGRINKADVAESLGEISKLTPIFGIVFLREKADIIAQIPFRITEEGPLLEIPRRVRLTSEAPQPTVAALAGLNRALHECIGYVRWEDGPARSAAETLRAGRGACRDVAVLLAAFLRQLGLAARLTSGYLREGEESEPRRAEGSLHAWTEVYLPGAGWVGMDATNGIFSNHNFIAAAVGLEPADVTPIDGSFYPRQETAAQMTSRLELVSL